MFCCVCQCMCVCVYSLKNISLSDLIYQHNHRANPHLHTSLSLDSSVPSMPSSITCHHQICIRLVPDQSSFPHCSLYQKRLVILMHLSFHTNIKMPCYFHEKTMDFYCVWGILIYLFGDRCCCGDSQRPAAQVVQISSEQ